MQPNIIRMSHMLALIFAGMLVSAPVLAEKPAWAGKPDKQKQKHDKPAKADASSDNHADNLNVTIHFGDQQRTVAHDYFAGQFRAGRCPPGLAKKNNGCMPPGQAKKWARGKPLPRDVIFYDLPPRLVVQLGTPPAGHRYVRVAMDILLIAVGTAMVVDAIEDLGKM